MDKIAKVEKTKDKYAINRSEWNLVAILKLKTRRENLHMRKPNYKRKHAEFRCKSLTVFLTRIINLCHAFNYKKVIISKKKIVWSDQRMII